MNLLLTAAKEYKKLGISTIATDANKRSLTQWKKYTIDLPTDQELEAMFADSRVKGIATICGKVSGNLEVIDIDCKYDLTGTLFENFMQLVVDADEELAKKLVVAMTVGGGYHLMYRSEEIGGNTKLASRPTTDAERKDNPHEKVKVLTETRGEAGYVIAVPTPGYKYITNTIRQLPTITPDERRTLLTIARSFNQVIEEATPAAGSFTRDQKPFNKSPFQDYNERGDIVGLLVAHGWRVVGESADKVTFLRPGTTSSKSSGDYHKTMNLFSVFTTSSEFEPNKGYRPAAVYAMLECNNDYKVAAQKLLNAGYGEPYKKISNDVRRFVEKKTEEEGLEGEKLKIKLADKFDMTIDRAGKVLENIEQEKKIEANTFWSWNSEKQKLTLSYTKFAGFLHNAGFGLYFYDQASPIFQIVHNDEGRLEIASSERIKKFVRQYIDDYPLDGVEYTKEGHLLEAVVRNSYLFSDNLYEFLGSMQIDFLRDTKDCCYIPFKNGIVEISATDIKLLKHGAVKKVIWKTDLIDFNVDLAQEDETDCEFMDFLEKICGGDEERQLSAISIIGYLIHKYKHPAKTFAVILAEETDDERKGGGTGKGIFIKALQKILPTVTIDGKNFKPDKSFAYQRVKFDTKLVAIQDVDKLFDFEKFYSIITEGWTIEKKNKDELYINYEDSPKVILTTNYTINDTGNHAKRRQRVIEFSDYFGADRSPEDEYGHLLFDDWDKDEWNRFYNFIFSAIQLYLKIGIKDITQGINYKTKKIRTQFGEDFQSWFTDFAGNGFADEKSFSSLYDSFLNSNDLEKKDFSQKRFKKGMEVAAENLGFDLITRRNDQDNGRRYLKMIKR